jgi:ABC-type glutathione transport system ATPase component
VTGLADEPVLAPTRTRTLLELRGLVVEYGAGPRPARAVDGVDLAVHEGEIVGLAGESGCGKSTIANALMQILRPPGRIAGGSILFQGEDLVGRSKEQLRQYRWRNVSIVLQSAMNALNPVMRVGDQFVDAMRAHEHINRRQALERAGELLEVVGIDRRRSRSYAHELSGGMRQRVALARALAQDARVLLMDEPFGAVDAITRDLLHDEVERIWQARDVTVLFVTHNVREAARLGDRIVLFTSRPGTVAATFDVPIPRPRRIESPEVSELAGRVTARLREEVGRHGR